MTYHDNSTPPTAHRRGGFSIAAIIGVLALIVIAGLTFSMMVNWDENRAAVPAAERTQTTSSGAASPAPKLDTTAPAQRPAPTPKQ
jgi:hypothetical protein